MISSFDLKFKRGPTKEPQQCLPKDLFNQLAFSSWELRDPRSTSWLSVLNTPVGPTCPRLVVCLPAANQNYWPRNQYCLQNIQAEVKHLECINRSLALGRLAHGCTGRLENSKGEATADRIQLQCSCKNWSRFPMSQELR